MDPKKIEKISTLFSEWLIEARGKSTGTAHNYGRVAKKLLKTHPEGADYAQIKQFFAENASSNVEAAVKLFAIYAYDNLGLRFEAKPEAPGAPIPISELHRTLFTLFQGLQPPLSASVCWDQVPSVDTWRLEDRQGEHYRPSGEQISALNLSLRNLRQVGRGSPLVFAKIEGSRYEHFSPEELAYPEVGDES